MASTCSGFTSHKRVSTSLGTSVQHKMKKMSKILLLSNVNKNCILSCMFSYNTIINFTELYKQEPTALVLFCNLKSNIWFASTLYVSHRKSFSQVRSNFRFDEDLHVDVLPPAESSLALFRHLKITRGL